MNLVQLILNKSPGRERANGGEALKRYDPTPTPPPPQCHPNPPPPPPHSEHNPSLRARLNGRGVRGLFLGAGVVRAPAGVSVPAGASALAAPSGSALGSLSATALAEGVEEGPGEDSDRPETRYAACSSWSLSGVGSHLAKPAAFCRKITAVPWTVPCSTFPPCRETGTFTQQHRNYNLRYVPTYLRQPEVRTYVPTTAWGTYLRTYDSLRYVPTYPTTAWGTYLRTYDSLRYVPTTAWGT